MSPAERVSNTAFSEGTEVTTATKASYVGKVTKAAKFGKKMKYQIEWFGHHSNDIWYDHFSIRRFKRKEIDQAWQDVSDDVKLDALDEAKKYLMMMPCMYPSEDVQIVLEEVGYPYGLQTVMSKLINRVGNVETNFGKTEELIPIKLLPIYSTEMLNGQGGDKLVGKKIRKTFDDVDYDGEVVSKRGDFYHVKYDDGDAEDLDGFEVIRYLWPRPQLPPCLGRRFSMLELFAGSCVVSRAFYQQEWETASHDIDPNSEASIKGDILSLDMEELPFVPDFIWASPPCDHFVNDNELDKSPVARLQNLIFMKMVQILAWAKQKHPHLIICIETPVFNIEQMPLMKEFMRHFQLCNVTVNYCTFEREEKKSTQLWSNFKILCEHFNNHKCIPERCCVMGNHKANQTKAANSSIPEPLAKECARVVNSKVTLDRVHRISAAKTARPQEQRPKRDCAEVTNS